MKKTKKNKIKPGYLGVIVVMAAAALTLLTASHCSTNKPDIILDPKSEDFYQMAHFLFTKHERKVFRSLVSPEARERFIRYFWEIRNPNPYADNNEFKLEIERRYDHVNRYLKEGNTPGWKTDRGRIYMLLGEPYQVEEQLVYNTPELHGLIFWYYTSSDLAEMKGGDMGLYILFVDTDGTKRYYIHTGDVLVTDRSDQTLRYPGTDLRLLDLAEQMKYKHITTKDTQFEKNNLAFDLTYDNRARAFTVSIEPTNLSFDEDTGDPDTMTAKIKIDLVLYESTEIFTKKTVVEPVKVKKSALLEKHPEPVTVTVPVSIKPGKVTVDAFVSDMLGDASKRDIFVVEIK